MVVDIDHHIVNFWRAVKTGPEKVAHHCDHPTFQADLTARHRWLREWGDLHGNSLLSVGSYLSRSSRATVVGRSHTAFATKARASAFRSAGGCPTPRWWWRTCRSTGARSSTATNLRCVFPSGPTSSARKGKSSP